MIKFTVPGQPVAKARARGAALKRCKKCQRKTARRVCSCGNDNLEFLTLLESTPKKTVVYENKVALYAEQARKELGITELLSVPIVLRVKAYFAIPVSRKKKLKEGDVHTQRPDLDNVLKSVKDAMNKVIYHDDALIWKVEAEKLWGDIPRVEVEVES